MTAMLAPLNQMQDLLQGIYDIQPGCAVGDFLITDEELARQLAPTARASRERVLILQEPDALNLSLYLEAELVERLSADDPLYRLHPRNFDDFATALEGLSHFLFLTWSATTDRQTSQLELETQAEVDKFICALFLSTAQGQGDADALHKRLFAAPAFDSRLNGEERSRYQGANRMAARYCRQLKQAYPHAGDRRDLLSELRRFYRQGARRKLARLSRLA